MDSDQKMNLFFVALFVLLPINITLLTTQQITATDWLYRHSVYIGQYLNGDFTPATIYPPLFHFLLIPFIAIRIPAYLIQTVFSLVNLAVIFWFLHKEYGYKTTFYVGLFLASSIIYMQVSSALMPQALDLLFFLPAVYFYLRKKYYHSLVMIVPLFLLHMFGLVYAFVLFAHSLIYKRWKYAVGVLAIALAFAPLYLSYLGLSTSWNYQAQVEYNAWFYMPAWHFFVTSGLLAWLFVPLALYRQWKRKTFLSERQILYLLWIVSFVPLAFGISLSPFDILIGTDIWRAMTFCIFPFYFLIASIYTGEI